MSLTYPQPVAFALSVDEYANARDAYLFEEAGNTGVAYTLILSSVILQTVGPAIRLYRRHGDDPASWVLLVVALSLVAIVAALLLRRGRMFVRPAAATVVSFDDAGLSIAQTNRRGARTTRVLPFDRIRKVRLLPQAIAIATTWRPLLIIPRAALPSDGAELMSFLDDRLTGKRLLMRLPSNRSTIANTSALK